MAESTVLYEYNEDLIVSKFEKVPRGIQDEKSSKDMASSRNLVSPTGAQACPKKGDGTRAGIHKDSKYILKSTILLKLCNSDLTPVIIS